MKTTSTKIDFLTENEVKELLKKDFSKPQLNTVRDIFLFACFTGLSYNDLTNLRKDHLVFLPNGSVWLRISIPKSSKIREIPLLDIPQRILEKYKNQSDNCLLPTLSQQLFNWYLKDICHKCNINKNITSLSARRTFATTIAFTNGISIQAIADILGHTSLKSTLTFLNITNEKISIDMEELTEKINKKKPTFIL